MTFDPLFVLSAAVCLSAVLLVKDRRPRLVMGLVGGCVVAAYIGGLR
jgi:hypothetical protein